jgi:diguanylate cyclase (GGDEF)-like protein
MKMSLRLMHLFFALALGAVYLSGLLIKNPAHNYTVLGLGMFIITGQKQFSRKWNVLMLALAIISMAALVYPLKSISWQLAAAGSAIFLSLYVLTAPFAYFMNGLIEQEKVLKGREEALNRLTTVGIKHLQEESEESEREIKETTAIYSAAKELNKTMTLDSCMEEVSEILKKVMKINFKISLEDISFVIIFKREVDYYIAKAWGYDEDALKPSEKQVVASVLRNVSKSDDVIYIPKTEDGGSVAGGALIKSVVYMPFYIGKKLLGVIFISSVKENIFVEKNIESLRILSNQIAIAMEKVHLYEEVQQMSITDGLTGLVVHRHFQEKLELEIKRAARYGGSLSLMMGDIDFFKKINDTYGHLAGDYILKTIALILKNHTLRTDIVARYGGEEFVIIMPECDKDEAHMRAVKIRKDIESYRFNFNSQEIKVTMSMGVAAYPGDAITRRTLIDKADKALYKAKEEGRNRVLKAV